MYQEAEEIEPIVHINQPDWDSMDDEDWEDGRPWDDDIRWV